MNEQLCGAANNQRLARLCSARVGGNVSVHSALNWQVIMVLTQQTVTIQSVLDVKDDNPLPKGATPTPRFNRSILILTPQRALKFTAMTQERHYVWLTALSFLSHSSLGANDLTALPPVPQQEYELPPRSTTASL